MNITVFGKKKQAKSGKEFMTYFSTLTKKTGEEISVEVKFREDCGAPAHIPINVIFEKSEGNLKKETYTDSAGDDRVKHILWIKNWKEGEPYVDKSLDDFE